MQLITNLADYSFLKFIEYKNLSLWDAKRYLKNHVDSSYEVVPLKFLIKEENHKVKPFLEPEKEFKILGVSNKEGIFDAYVEKGKNINQPYKKVEVNWLAYNPYRINVGSIGIKKEEHKHNLISPAYVVFSCNEKLLPDFLYKIFKTDTFNKIIRDNTTGSVRQNLSFNKLKEIKIPLPDLNIQRRLLKTYYEKEKKADVNESKAKEQSSVIEKYLGDVLEIEFANTKEQEKMTFVRFSEVERWAVDHLRNQPQIREIKKGKYKVHKLGSLIKYLQYGISEKANSSGDGVPMLRMNNIKNAQLDVTDLKYYNVPEEKKDKLLLQKGDLLFNRTNSKELVGKTAVFDLDEEYTFASYLIRIQLDEHRVNTKFINFLFNSSIGRKQIDITSRQILGQANINSKELREFLFPIPPMEIQNKIVENIEEMRNTINKLLTSAEKNRSDAIKEFEEAIYKG